MVPLEGRHGMTVGKTYCSHLSLPPQCHLIRRQGPPSVAPRTSTLTVTVQDDVMSDWRLYIIQVGGC